MKIFLLTVHFFFVWKIELAYGLLLSDVTPQTADSSHEDKNSTNKINIKYGNKGWEFASDDGRYKLQFQSRLQFRYAYPVDTDPITFDDFQDETQNILKVNRARLKIGGNAFQEWLKYYWEYELASGNLLDFQMMIEKYSALRFRVGQWKARYSRERIISSGKQQTIDRSLINRAFTIDRQQGVSIFGHLKRNSVANVNYWFEILTGTGRGNKSNDDKNLMYVVRLQWNFLGDEINFVGSDLKIHRKPAANLAIAAVTNRSPYTRFSQTGGGSLEGFEDGQPGQYRVNQWMAETAFMYHGFAWQHEFHWKEITNRLNGKVTTLLGNYLQLGYFFHYWVTWVPKPLELAYRFSIFDPDRDITRNSQYEHSMDINWFFNEHANKMTAEISFFDFEKTPENQRDGWRFRIQWDVSM